MAFSGMCRCEGYSFQAVDSGIWCINQRVQVQNRESFSRKLINFSLDQGNRELPLKNMKKSNRFCFGWTVFETSVLSGKLWDRGRGILGVKSIIGQQNSLERALVWTKGCRVPVAHPHPKIPKLSARGFLMFKEQKNLK